MPDEHDDGPPHPARSEADWERLARAVEGLSERVERLERELRIAPSTSPEPAPASPAAPPPPQTRAPTEAKPSARDVAARLFDPGARAPEGTAGKQEPRKRSPTGPFAQLREESGPVVWLGITGGLALLMGLLYFAWHSIQQGWIPAEVRLVLAGSVGAAALGLAWRLAPRGHTALSEGLGGAGLGAWFGAALVARHGHAFIGPTATFALLVVGAFAGLSVAAHRNLRKLALFATLGAFLTPLTIGTHSLGISELLGYQLVVVALLYALEHRRPWPELGHLGNVASWLLLVYWSQKIGGTTSTEELTWLFVLFGLGHVQLVSLLWRGNIALGEAAPRSWLHVFGAWAVAGVLTETGEVLGAVSLGMAAIDAGTGLLLSRVVGRNVHGVSRGALLGAYATVAWLQVFSFGATYFERLGAIYWWTGMASLTTVAHLRSPSLAKGAALSLPLYAALALDLDAGSPTPAWVGFYLAALPLLIGLWPRAGTLAERVPMDATRAIAVLFGCAAWAGSSWQHLDGLEPREGWFVASCWVAVAVVTARSIRAPSPARAVVLLIAQSVLLASSVSLSIGLGFFRPRLPFAPGQLWQLGVLLGVASLAAFTSLGFRSAARERSWRTQTFEAAALLRATALTIVAMLLVTGAVAHVSDSASGARSLNQAGWSVCWAVAGLTLLLRGLFARRGLWRKAGLVLLFTTAGKLLVVDLIAVSMVWRVLSFMGLGVCMLAGAYFYRRLADSLKAEAPAPDGPLQSPVDP